MKKWLIRTEEDPTCKLLVTADTEDEALRKAGNQLPTEESGLIAVPWELDVKGANSK